MLFKLDNLAQLDAFDSIIDARTPSEYALDHIPSAHNAPTMSDDERVRIGTTYKQLSAFEAKKRGAALAARISRRILNNFLWTNQKIGARSFTVGEAETVRAAWSRYSVLSAGERSNYKADTNTTDSWL